MYLLDDEHPKTYPSEEAEFAPIAYTQAEGYPTYTGGAGEDERALDLDDPAKEQREEEHQEEQQEIQREAAGREWP